MDEYCGEETQCERPNDVDGKYADHRVGAKVVGSQPIGGVAQHGPSRAAECHQYPDHRPPPVIPTLGPGAAALQRSFVQLNAPAGEVVQR